MPRAIWSGSISFGLVNIPVKLYNAVSRKSVHFNQLDAKTGARVKRKWISAADGRDLERHFFLHDFPDRDWHRGLTPGTTSAGSGGTRVARRTRRKGRGDSRKEAENEAIMCFHEDPGENQHFSQSGGGLNSLNSSDAIL